MLIHNNNKKNHNLNRHIFYTFYSDGWNPNTKKKQKKNLPAKNTKHPYRKNKVHSRVSNATAYLKYIA